jgi:hypothetical protein
MLWDSSGVIFDPRHPTRGIKRFECTAVICMSREEAEEQALTLCRAWIDGLRTDLTMDDETREQLEQRMDELDRLYAETHDPEVARRSLGTESPPCRMVLPKALTFAMAHQRL